MNRKLTRGVSGAVIAAIVVVIIIIAAVAAIMLTSHKPTTTTTSTTTTTTPSMTTTSTTTTTTSTTTTTPMTITLSSPNSSTLVDVSQTAPPDALDPATGFYVQDGPLFTAVFQELVEFNGSNYHEVVPVIAQNYTTTNYQHWIFYIRQGIYFPDGVQVNASTVWFSFYRTILMGQGPGVANYIELLFNATVYAQTGYAIPWGVNYAIQNATGLPTANNYTLTAEVLASILSHFNANNATIQKIMSYPNQAVVVLGPYEVEINTLEPYRFFIYDIASWWGAIVNPVVVDEHGGVQPNTANSYLDEYGMNGTGPYLIVKVTPGFSTIVLEANPNYWGKSQSVPAVAQPAHIKYIVIDYGLSHNDRVEDFLTNQAQISYVSIPYLGQILGQKPYSVLPLNVTFRNFGAEPGVLYISMNMEQFPTNITDFRLAIVHAINYQQLLQIFSYNGKILAAEYLGPISPQFPGYYNPDNLTPYQYNPSLAMKYLNEAGYQGDFYVVLPNGTVLGNPNGQELPTLNIYALAPVTPLEQDELEIITQDLQQIGLSVSVKYVLPSVTDGWTTPSGTPDMVDLGWFPDWPDPVFQQLMPLTDVQFGGISGNLAWVNISTLQQIYQTLPFITNQTEQIQLVAKVYQIIYNEAPYAWLPFPDTYYLVQPYVQGFVYNPYVGYFYNMMYYSTYTYSSQSM
ncbi:ABC transporter substrate-binding protein [Sulfurisphaera ohwakuensis]|uniref:ABC transporter substrate-binding protein n=2 Tax=Sulfurisphaera ohwakuensis TaxID=69656 RepID=A0A650CKC2_SULOH|nr:ABC-type transport system substrate-binding protein [Sulfurisphaera ohwakuensis]QGR18135.1 ABC transporter substrate-binding protein [Sulfurisphaera ohwakuensis]